TILQLDTGEVAVVVDQDDKFRLKPKVMVITDEEGQPLEEKRVISLAAQQPGNTEVTARILKDLSTASFNIDMREIQQEYQRLDSSHSQASRSNSPGGIFRRFFGKKN
ncbi:MAG: hypothetical protein RLN96_01390, partial [Pseudomonadales bacterium]